MYCIGKHHLQWSGTMHQKCARSGSMCVHVSLFVSIRTCVCVHVGVRVCTCLLVGNLCTYVIVSTVAV